MPTPRSAALIAVFTVASLLFSAAPCGYAAQGAERDNVETLRRQAFQARRDLEMATQRWEQRKKLLARSQARLTTALRDLAEADAELNKIRGPLARLANVAYQQPGAAGAMAIFSGSPQDQALRSASDVSHIANNQNELIHQATQLRERHESLTATVQQLQSHNAVEETRVQQDVAALKQKSADLTLRLTLALSKLRADRDKRFALGCDRSLVASARRYPNGLIPSRYLCPLPQKGNYLRADAALAFYKLNAAYKKRFGSRMCVRDSYRSLAEQQQVYAARPGYAAVPGRSNHGWGTAVDLCGGVQNQGSVPFNWLRANSLAYGWFHPLWAYSSPFEPWHWEFKVG